MQVGHGFAPFRVMGNTTPNHEAPSSHPRLLCPKQAAQSPKDIWRANYKERFRLGIWRVFFRREPPGCLDERPSGGVWARFRSERNGEVTMNPRAIRERIRWVGTIDWNRRLFDSPIPLPVVVALTAKSRLMRVALKGTLTPQGVYEGVVARTECIDSIVEESPKGGFRQGTPRREYPAASLPGANPRGRALQTACQGANLVRYS